MYIDRLDIEITKREILTSIIIVLFMLISGLGIHSKIKQNNLDNNEVYNKALKITSSEEFTYGMKTNIGNAFVYGNLSAVDPVSYPELNDKYIYVSKETQKYTQHTRTVTYTDSDGETHTKIETYYSWDRINFEARQCKEIIFNGVSFLSSKFDFPSATYIATQYKGFNDIRYIYYGIPAKKDGTILASLKNNSIYNIKNEKKLVPFHSDNLQNTYNSYLNKGTLWLVLFWIGWIILTAFLVFAFYHFDNNWLE